MRDAASGEECLATDEHRQHLDRLTETHVVGETAAQTHAFKEREPAEPLPLVVPQCALKALRLILGLGAFAAGQFFANPFERLVDVRLRLARQKRIEKRHLDPAIPQAAVVLLCKHRHRFDLCRE